MDSEYLKKIIVIDDRIRSNRIEAQGWYIRLMRAARKLNRLDAELIRLENEKEELKDKRLLRGGGHQK